MPLRFPGSLRCSDRQEGGFRTKGASLGSGAPSLERPERDAWGPRCPRIHQAAWPVLGPGGCSITAPDDSHMTQGIEGGLESPQLICRLLCSLSGHHPPPGTWNLPWLSRARLLRAFLLSASSARAWVPPPWSRGCDQLDSVPEVSLSCSLGPGTVPPSMAKVLCECDELEALTRGCSWTVWAPSAISCVLRRGG